MELLGTFAPPAMGQSAVPIPLVGPGKFEITPEGLSVSGYRKGGAYVGCLVAVGVIAGIFGLAIVGARYDMPKWLLYAFIGAVVSGAWTLVQRGKGKQGANAKPWAFVIPWSSVTDVNEDPQVRGAIVVRVKKFKPSGTLHFQPPEGTSVLELISSIKRSASIR